MIIPFKAAVVCVDGSGGSLTSVVVQRPGLQAKQLVVRENGHFWHQQHVTIPVSAIVGVTEETITVSLKRHSIDALPADRPAPFVSFPL